MDFNEIANQVVLMLKPVADAGGNVALGVAANALWDWLKKKVRRPALTAAVSDIERNPKNETSWEVLRLQIRKALEEDETFRSELLALLPEDAQRTAISQTAITGQGGVSVQSAGDNVNIRIQR